MTKLEEHLIKYAKYHRDPRNIRTHFLGISLIVLAISILLSRPRIEYSYFCLSPTLLLVVASSIFYLKLNRPIGFIMTALLLSVAWLGAKLATLDTDVWLTTGLTLFLFGWTLQFIGHHYEGKKPAFLDDIRGLIIGPLFIVVEFLFIIGLFEGLRRKIESEAGPAVRNVTRDKVKY